jgi:hypothetical protein
MRETTISISYEEKQRLDEAARELCGTTEVPYGEVVTILANRVTDGSNN